MKILSITAGAAGMYCGSCLRDNALAIELIARGHDTTLVPVYTPTLTDDANVSRRDSVLRRHPASTSSSIHRSSASCRGFSIDSGIRRG